MKYIVRKGKSGAEEIEQLMVRFRNNPPKQLAGSVLEWVKDYDTLIEKNLLTGEQKPINQKTTANVLQFFTKDGTKVSVRPSGTEPKIKFYIEVKSPLGSRQEFDEVELSTSNKIDEVMNDLAI
jgi:phosphoglucomutase